MKKLVLPGLLLALLASTAHAGGLSDYSSRYYGWQASSLQSRVTEQMAAAGRPELADYVLANNFYGDNANDYTTYRMQLALAGISVESAAKQRLDKQWGDWTTARDESQAWGAQGRRLLGYALSVHKCGGAAPCAQAERELAALQAQGITKDMLPTDVASADAMITAIKDARLAWLRQNPPPVGPVVQATPSPKTK